MLSDLQLSQYQRDGFLVLNNFISADECRTLIQRATQLITEFDPNEIKVSFSTKDNSHTKNNYFLDSASKIHFFLEEDALDEKNNLIKNKLFSINKIGHAMHDIDPIFNRFSRTTKIKSLLTSLHVQQPLLIQSMYLCKQPYIGAEVPTHQDNTYIYVKEQPVTGLWFALEDATIENGCLWAIPGGHQQPLKSRMLLDANKQITTEVYDDTPWELEKMIPLEAPQGSLVLIHGLLPHMSKQNTSPLSRHAYSLHIVSGEYEYAADNWLQRTSDFPFNGW